MLDKFVEGVPNLLADILEEQRRTNDLLSKFVLAIQSGAAKSEAGKAIENAKTAAAYVEQKAVKAEPSAPAEEVKPAHAEHTQDAKAADQAAEFAPAADYKAAAAKVTALANAKGREAAVEILAKFSAKTLKDVPAEKFGEVIDACNEALA